MQVHTLGDIAKFRLFDTDNGVAFDNATRRTVRLEVNCEVPTMFSAMLGRDMLRLLAVVEGHAEISFVADGPVSVFATPEVEKAEVWWWCSEVESYAVEMPDAETFTTIANRRERNPELEHMMSKLISNMDRRMADLTWEMEQRQAQAEERAAAAEAALKAAERKNAKRTKGAAPAAAGGGTGSAGQADPPGTPSGDEGGGDDAGNGQQ